MSDVVLSQNEICLRDRIFDAIISDVGDLLPEDENACYSEKPIVDIEAIALKAGIIIVPVQQEVISNNHAEYKEIDTIDDRGHLVKKHVILVKEHDTDEEKRFSISHEIYHFLKAESGSARDDTSLLRILESRRFVSNTISVEINEAFIIEKIVQNTTEILGKRACEKKARAEFNKALKPVYEKIGKAAYPVVFEHKKMEEQKNEFALFINEIESAISTATRETINEEVADYFAANLIVPTERFILWEDKTDKEIAQAFGVPERCIKKRREEIEYELNYLTPDNLSSDDENEDDALSPLGELKHNLEGYNSHDPGRV